MTFESKEQIIGVDEYGVSNSDLHFVDIQTVETNRSYIYFIIIIIINYYNNYYYL